VRPERYFSVFWVRAMQVFCTRLDGSAKLAAVVAKAGEATRRVVVRPDVTRQRLLGFGGSMTESSAQLIHCSPDRERILDALFLPPPAGAGMSCLRLCVGASDFATEYYNYQPTPESCFDMSRENAVLLPVLRSAKARNPALTLVASPWTAPEWMKENGKANGGRLSPSRHNAYARYLMQYLSTMEEMGFPISALALQNECWHSADSAPTMLLDPEETKSLAGFLVPMLRQNGIGTQILVHDHNYDLVEKATDLMRAAGDLVDGTAWHAYGGHPRVLEDFVKEFAQHEVFFFEQTAHGESNFGGDVGWALEHLYFGSLQHGSRSVLHWNVALDPRNGPRLESTCPTCRGLLTVDPAGGFHEEPEYTLVGHFAGALPSGSVMVDVDGVDGVEVVAGISPSGALGVVMRSRGPGGAVELVVGQEPGGVVDVPENSLVSVVLPSGGWRVPRPLPCFLAQPVQPPVRFPSRFYLRSFHGTWVAAHGESSAAYQSVAPEPGLWELWRAIPTGNAVYALQSVAHSSFLHKGGKPSVLEHSAVFASALRFVIRITAEAEGRIQVNLIADQGSLGMPEKTSDGPYLKQENSSGWESFWVVAG